MRRTIARGLGGLTLLLSLGGTAPAGPEEPRADFVFVNGGEPRTFDPQLMTGPIEGRIAEAIYEGLTYRDARTLKPMPGQAESWEVSPDGRRYTFHIRPSARWSNGDPVTAHDFVRAWMRLVDPAVGAEYAYLLYFVRHARAFHAYESDLLRLRGNPQAETAEEREGIVEGFRALVGRHPAGVPAHVLQRWVERPAWDEAIARIEDPTLRLSLSKTEGSLTPAEGDALRTGLAAEAEARSTALEAARAHFGKDEGVFAVDDRTLVVELRSFTPYFLEMTSAFFLAPVHSQSLGPSEDKAFSPHRIVTNGPFGLQSTSGDRIRLRKSATYRDADAVSLTTIDALPTEDPEEALALYSAGTVDWLPGGGPKDIAEFRATPGAYVNPAMVLYFLRIHCSPPSPLADPRVRRALGLAIDRKNLVKAATRGLHTPATTMVPLGMPGYESPESGFGFDPATARRLFREAGFPDAKGFPRLDLALNVDAGHIEIAEAVRRQMKENLGVRVQLQVAGWPGFLEAVDGRRYDLARGGWIGDVRDPIDFLYLWTTRGTSNDTGWGNFHYDRLIDWARDVWAFESLPLTERSDALARFKDRSRVEGALAALAAAKEPDRRLAAASALRMGLLREAEAILVQDAFPVIPLFDYAASGILRPGIEGFHTQIETDDGRLLPNLEDLHPLRALRWSQASRKK